MAPAKNNSNTTTANNATAAAKKKRGPNKAVAAAAAAAAVAAKTTVSSGEPEPVLEPEITMEVGADMEHQEVVGDQAGQELHEQMDQEQLDHQLHEQQLEQLQQELEQQHQELEQQLQPQPAVVVKPVKKKPEKDAGKDKTPRRKHHHTPIEIEIRVQQLHELNYSYTSIRSTVEKATGYKISNGTIGRIVNKRGKKREFGPDYKRSGRPTRRNQELIQQVAALVTDSASPLTQREISKKLNLSKTTINRIIRDDLPKLDQSILGSSKPLDRETIKQRAMQQNEIILQTAASILANNEQLTQRAIAKKMNVSNSNINRIINQYLPTLKDAMKARKTPSKHRNKSANTSSASVANTSKTSTANTTNDINTTMDTTDAEADIDTNADADAGADIGIDAEADADAEVEADAGAEAETEAEMETVGVEEINNADMNAAVDEDMNPGGEDVDDEIELKHTVKESP